jgi:hypothetical protein
MTVIELKVVIVLPLLPAAHVTTPPDCPAAQDAARDGGAHVLSTMLLGLVLLPASRPRPHGQITLRPPELELLVRKQIDAELA